MAVAVAVLLLTGVAYLAYRATSVPASGVQVVAEKDCPASEFTCVTLRVPLDHGEPAGAAMDVTFAVLAASGEREGVFVTAAGGPGASGISLADGYTSAFDPAIREAYDIVFFDPRGIGLSEPIQCLDASLAFYSTDVVPTLSAAAAEEFAAVAREYSADCIADTGVDPDNLAAYATDQVVEDLELFRRWLGIDQLHLYGESYGTQLVQVYAAAHPERVAALMLDGPVDLALEGTDYWLEGALSFEATLVHALESCDEACVEDTGGDLLAIWDDLAAELQEGPRSYTLTLGDGTSETRELSFGDLETAAAAYVYAPSDQMLLQRAVAYAARGELAPMARMAAIGVGQDIETFEAYGDATWSDALYNAVQCSDYAYGSGDVDEREAAYLAQGAEAGIDAHRLGSVYYGDLPCVSWPVHAPPGPRPPHLTTDAYPTLVLASTTDPATPYAGALRLFEAAGDGYLVTQPGGPHVIFGRGNACPDDLVTAFLVDGTLPDERETTCDPMAPDPYYPIPPASADESSDPITVVLGIDDEIALSPDYWAWTGQKALVIGCLHGGTLRYALDDVGSDVSLSECEMVAGLPLSGDGQIDDVEGTFSLDVTGPEGTDLAYVRSAEGALTVAGTWFGEPVDLEG